MTNKVSGIANVFPIYELLLKEKWHIKQVTRVKADLLLIVLACPEIMSYPIRECKITLSPGRTFASFYSIRGTICV